MNAFTGRLGLPAGHLQPAEDHPLLARPQQARLARLPGVRAVRLYRGGLLDIGERRVW